MTEYSEALKLEIEKCPGFSGNLAEYLATGLKSQVEEGKYSAGWNFYNNYILTALKPVLHDPSYWEMKYNSDKVKHIIILFSETLDDSQQQQLGSFVYAWNCKARECQKAETESKIMVQGYRKITGQEKELDGHKVSGYFNIPKIGIMGGFDSLEQTEGRLSFIQTSSDGSGMLMLIPKGRRSRGYYIRDAAFIKEVIA